MESYLQKWTNYLTGWKTRYFVLHNGLLYYCKEQGQKVKGVVHLNISTIVRHPNNIKRFHIDTGCTKIHLKAQNGIEADSWIKELISQQNDLKFIDDNREMRQSLNQMIELDRSEIIHMKIGELWSIQAQLESNIDLISQRRKSDPISHIAQISRDMKILMQEVLRLFEQEKQSLQNYNDQFKQSSYHLKSLVDDVITKYSPQKELPNIRLSHLTSSESFQDAQSNSSDYKSIIDSDDSYKRTCLPILRRPFQHINIWSHIRETIGKDFLQIRVPLQYHEPLSLLQRLAEDLTYYQILVKANQQDDPDLRSAYVALFAVSTYFNTKYRTIKPFTPLIGETFELQTHQFSFLSEQVSQNTVAFDCDSPSFRYWGQIKIQCNYKGMYLQVTPVGVIHIELKQHQEHFIWKKCHTNVQNIMIGQMHLEHHGNILIENQNGQLKAKLQLEKGGTLLHGCAYNQQGQQIYQIDGNWDKKVNLKSQSKVIDSLALQEQPIAFEYNYQFTNFALQLNIQPEIYGIIPATDSRNRPDIRALENGNFDLAYQVNKRILFNEKEIKPRWFDLQGGNFIYSGQYWEQKSEGSFTHIPDIFRK